MASRSVPDLVAVEEAMAEVRRNWSVMLQEGVRGGERDPPC
jgi:hypothetical protein